MLHHPRNRDARLPGVLRGLVVALLALGLPPAPIGGASPPESGEGPRPESPAESMGSTDTPEGDIGIRFFSPFDGMDVTEIGSGSFSVPRPIVVLDPVVIGSIDGHPRKTVVEQVGPDLMRIRISGSVFDSLADMVADGQADIRQVTLHPVAGGAISVPVEAIAPAEQGRVAPHPFAEELARHPSLAAAVRPYPFAGRFESPVLTLQISTGFNGVYVEATNANRGSSGSTLDISASIDAERTRFEIMAEVDNRAQPGLFVPILVYIEDPTVSADNIDSMSATINSTVVGLRSIGGQLQLDRPILGVNREVRGPIPNLVHVVGDPDHFVISYKGINARFDWSYTAAPID